MTFINTVIGLSPCWERAGYHLKTCMFPTATGKSQKFCISKEELLLLLFEIQEPQFLHVRFSWSTHCPALGSDLCFLKTQISRHRNEEKGKSTSSTDSRKTGALASLYLLKGCTKARLQRAFFSSETHQGGALPVTRRGYMVFSSTSKKKTKAIHRLIQIHWLMRWWCISLSHYKQAERFYWKQQHANGTKGN